jgi:hypothetical protein
VALTDDFQSVVLEEKQDAQKIEELSQSGDVGDTTNLASAALSGIRAIEQDGEALIRPYEPMIDALYTCLQELHGSAYSWNPPPVTAVEKLSSTRMREYVRGWITEWDLRRLYPDAQLDIEMTDVQQTYDEDQELESILADETDGSDPMEAEDPMLAVALQNQAPM